MKIPNLVKGLLFTGAITTVIWTGSATLQEASEFIQNADIKVLSAFGGIEMLKGDIVTKKDRIEELKAEIVDLKEQLENNQGDTEEINKLKEQLAQATAQVESLTAEIETATAETTRLTNELNTANTEAEALQLILDNVQSKDTVIPTIGEVEQFITDNGESIYNPETDKITFNPYSVNNEANLQKETALITNYADTINNMLVAEGLTGKGITITVEVGTTQGATTLFNLYINGASTEAKAILTKNKMNTAINNNQYYIDRVTFN